MINNNFYYLIQFQLQEQEVSENNYITLQNISRNCEFVDSTLLQSVTDYKCATVKQFVQFIIIDYI